MKNALNPDGLFTLLFADQGEGYLNIWAKREKESVSRWFDLRGTSALADAMREAAKLDGAGYEVYFGCCTSAVQKNSSARCCKGDALRAPAYYIDVDTWQDASKRGKRVPEGVARAMEMLNGLPFPPSACVRSGHGLHAYWLLKEPLEVYGNYKAADARLKRFAEAVALAIGCPDLDTHASEVCRVLRVPGTHNRKGGGSMSVELLRAEGLWYDAAELDRFAAAQPASTASEAEAHTSAGSVEATHTRKKRAAKKAPRAVPDVAHGQDAEAQQADAPAHAAAAVDALAPVAAEYQPGGRYYLTDAQILDAIKRGQKFADCVSLLNGNTAGFASQSEADLRLCNAFAFFTGGDPARVDGLFRGTLLYRKKWDERHGAQTYGEATVEKACRDTGTFYRGRDYKLDKLTEEQKSRFAAVAAAYARASGGMYKVTPYAICAAKIDRDGNEILEPLADFVPEPLETVQRDDGAESLREYVFSGWDYAGRRLPRVTVPAAKLKAFNWVMESWPGAVLEPGNQKADKLRAAIQKAERELATRRTVYTHSGWRELGGKYVYLFNGGAAGADGLSVELGGKLERYALPTGSVDAETMTQAVRASLELLELAPWAATVPLLVSMYLAPLCEFFNLSGERVSHLTIVRGKTQSKKSTLTALMLSHFGPEFTYNSLPLNFQSTANAICAQLFQLKDMPAVVDDFHPTASERRGSLDEMTRTARRISRAVADDAGRARLESDGRNIQADRPARGLVLMTAEFEPDLGESGDSRCFIVPLNPGDVKTGDMLDEAQEAARKGLYALAMRGYIGWLCWRVNVHSGAAALAEELRTRFRAHRRELGRMNADFAAHGRLGTAGAHLLTALDVLLDFAEACGAVDADRRAEIAGRGQTAILADMAAHASDVCAADPVWLFLTALDELGGTTRALLPADPGYAPDDDFCGYQTADRLYLAPKAAVGRVMRLCRDSGTSLSISARELWRRLDEAGAVLRGTARGKSEIACTQHVPGLGKPFYCVRLDRARLGNLREAQAQTPQETAHQLGWSDVIGEGMR